MSGRDDGLRARIEALIESRDRRGFSKTATNELREALNPPQPFVFPTGLGAVIECKSGVGLTRFTRSRRGAGSSWTREDSGYTWSEGEILGHCFTNFRTLSEGVTG